MAFITVNGVRLAYDEYGAGPPVIWVHGSWTDRRGADLLAPLVAERYRFITYDRRGHSQSERRPGHQSLSDHVDDLAALVEQLDAVPAHLVTNSYGGPIALRLALRRPELVASLCLHEPDVFGVLPDDPDVRQALDDLRARCAPVVAEIEQGNAAGAARLFMETVAMGPGAWEAMPEELRRTVTQNAPTFLDDVTEAIGAIGPLAGITHPVLLTGGGHSYPLAAAANRCLADELPNSRRYTFADAGHVPHRTHPDELAGVVLGFLADVERAAPAHPVIA